MKKLKTLTWNIGGGKILKEHADSKDRLNYSDEGSDYILDYIKATQPDIICLQETHMRENFSHAQRIAEALKYTYTEHTVDISHIDDTYKIGNAIISRFPIKSRTTGIFTNLHLPITLEDGRTQMMHDKGFVRATIDIGENTMDITTLHLMPFRRYDIAVPSLQATEILSNVEDLILTKQNTSLIMGDFNIDLPEILYLFPKLQKEFSEVATQYPTTPKGRHYDHALYCGVTLKSTEIMNNVKTDHYPVVCTFTL